MELVATGIEGLDSLLYGGIRRNSCYLVEGIPGVGKTILGLQFIYQGIDKYNENGIIVLLEELPEQVEEEALSFGWDLKKKQEEGKLRIVYMSPDNFVDGRAFGIISHAKEEISAKRLFLDSLSHLDYLGLEIPRLRKIQVDLHNTLRKLKLTSIFTKEFYSIEPTSIGIEEYVIDGVIRLTSIEAEANKRYRYLEIMKSRAQPHITGKYLFTIGQSGIRLFPVVSTTIDSKEKEEKKAKLPIGIAGLDELLGGGIEEGSSLLLLGEPNSGRTLLSLQFLYTGAMDYKEPGIFFSFKRLPKLILEKFHSFSWDVNSLIKEGTLKIRYTVPFSMRVDEQILIMADLIQQTAAKRIVLDSIPSLVAHIEDILHIREKIFQLIEILRSLKCTSFLISDILSGQMSDKFGTQELVDSVFLLKALKGREARERYLEITKFHAFTKPMGNYVLRINPAGIELLSHPGVTYK